MTAVHGEVQKTRAEDLPTAAGLPADPTCNCIAQQLTTAVSANATC